MTKRQSRARKRVLVAGRVRTGPRDGHLFVGVQNDPSSYDCLKGRLTGDRTDALIIGDEQDALDLIRILVETMLLETSTEDLIGDIEAMLREVESSDA